MNQIYRLRTKGKVEGQGMTLQGGIIERCLLMTSLLLIMLMCAFGGNVDYGERLDDREWATAEAERLQEETRKAFVDFNQPTESFKAVVEEYLNAHRSDNKERGYSRALQMSGEEAVKSKDEASLMRSRFMQAMLLFLDRDFSKAVSTTDIFRKLAREGKVKDKLAKGVDGLWQKILKGELDLEKIRIMFSANAAEESGDLAEDLRRYGSRPDVFTGDRSTAKPGEIEANAMALALWAKELKLPVEFVREQVHQAECVSHLHSLMSKWQRYRQDKGQAPPMSEKIAETGQSWLDEASWVNLMQAYIDDPKLETIDPKSPNIVLTPGTEITCPSRSGKDAEVSSQLVHYGMNMTVDPEQVGPDDSAALIFADSTRWYVIGPTWGLRYLNYCHSNGLNCAFADGHVEWFSREEIEASVRKWANEQPWSPL